MKKQNMVRFVLFYSMTIVHAGSFVTLPSSNKISFLPIKKNIAQPIKSCKSSPLYTASMPESIIKEESSKESEETTPSVPYSKALCTMVGGKDTTNDESMMQHFFQSLWQKTPKVYRDTCDTNNTNALHDQVSMGLNGIIALLEQGCQALKEPNNPNWRTKLPMIFDIHKQPIPISQIPTKYNNDLFQAYMEGCSIVLNHCDELCPHTAALCEDLQQSFPFAYANAYLTPPSSQAVSAHADDRDVFVIQVYGTKSWKVYEHVPIQYPYSHEQVGKNNLDVPSHVLQGPCSIQTTLEPGDVLYIPRGHVHEAFTYSNIHQTLQPSFHITIALATFDWTFTGVLNTMIQNILDSNPHYRKALPLDLGSTQELSSLRVQQFNQQLEQTFVHLQNTIQTQNIHEFLQQKYSWHQNQSKSIRQTRILEHQQQQQQQQQLTIPPTFQTGNSAIRHLTWLSKIRSCTDQEKSIDSMNALKYDYRESTKSLFQSLEEHILIHNPKQVFTLTELKSYLSLISNDTNNGMICDLTLYSFIRSYIQQGKIGIVHE